MSDNEDDFLYEEVEVDNYYLEDIGRKSVKSSKKLYKLEEFSSVTRKFEERIENNISERKGTSYGKCNNCHEDNTSLLIRQDRSGDEGSSAYVICHSCDFKERVS